ncbi:MAG: hypothetical protein DRP83_00305 [Planctomycetota bacterium]|nr:MAG: hypothetical protein DRP83_00305 [Planctomycetota bacterium]
MPLVQSAFINGLIAAENPPKESIDQQAKGFVDAFIPYIKGGVSNGVPITQPTCDLPSAQNALRGGIAGAFALASGPAVSDAIGAAILAFFNAGPVSAFFTSALSASIFVPLSNFTSGINTPIPEQSSAKATLVAAITAWLNAGPSGFAIIFPGSPSDIKAPIT